MLRRTAPAAVLLALLLAPAAHADDAPALGNDPGCRGSLLSVTVCATDTTTTPGTPGTDAMPSATGGKATAKPVCTYTKLVPQPPPDNYYWKGHQGEKGAVYGFSCADRQGARTVFIPDATAPGAAPAVNPETVARQAMDQIRLDGPTVASPRAAGKYLVGVPMWMHATPSTSTFGPATATATAGATTVTATAKVTSVVWDMGDTTTVTCTGPGTPYNAAYGKSMSPDCGHRYAHSANNQPDGRYHGSATSTWTVTWKVVGGTGESGEFTETRTTPFSVSVGELQVLN